MTSNLKQADNFKTKERRIGKKSVEFTHKLKISTKIFYIC